ncbi:MAG: flavodoxin family protein [Candidatus Brocadiia bacterium]
MDVLIFAASPNKDGLTAECAEAALEGVRLSGAAAEVVYLNDEDIGLCQACARGWGTCLKEHYCQVEDGFQGLHKRTRSARAYVLVSPVYFGELSESAKAFFDRLRRCEATRGDESALRDKPIIGVAAAGGSGRGTDTCLHQMRRLFDHLGCDVADLLTITQRSRSYKPDAIRSAAQALGESLKQG